jgi:hypothetical protein
MLRGVYNMNPAGVRSAGPHGGEVGAVTGKPGRCSPQSVLIAEQRPRFLSSRKRVVPSIALIATLREKPRVSFI